MPQAACIQLYRRFLESPNFSSWFERRRGRAAAWQEACWAEACLERGTEQEFEDCSEVQLIEAFASIERKLEVLMNRKEESASVRPSPCLPLGPLARKSNSRKIFTLQMGSSCNTWALQMRCHSKEF